MPLDGRVLARRGRTRERPGRQVFLSEDCTADYYRQDADGAVGAVTGRAPAERCKSIRAKGKRPWSDPPTFPSSETQSVWLYERGEGVTTTFIIFISKGGGTNETCRQRDSDTKASHQRREVG